MSELSNNTKMMVGIVIVLGILYLMNNQNDKNVFLDAVKGTAPIKKSNRN